MTRLPTLTQVLLIWLGLALLFAIWPQLDIHVSRLFYDAANQKFPMAEMGFFNWLRETFWNLMDLSAVVIVVFAIHAQFSRQSREIPARFWNYLVLFVLLGPLLVINGLFKSFWGRARPANIEIFGGTAEFSLPWEITDQCLRNCSFASGEASGATMVAIFLGLLLWYVVPRVRRPVLFWCLFAFMLFVSLLRVMMGRHFLSDILWAMVMTSSLAYGLAHVLRMGEVFPLVTRQALVHDTRVLGQDIANLMRGLARRGWNTISRPFGRRD